MIVKLDIRPPAKEDEEIDLSKLNTFDILARTRYNFSLFSHSCNYNALVFLVLYHQISFGEG